MELFETAQLSWELASRLVARHPQTLRMFHAFPGGGQYDVLWVVGERNRPDIPMNRAGGTIQVHARADGEEPSWHPADWSTYSRSHRERFLEALERAAGLTAPREKPQATPESLTYEVISALVQRAPRDRPITVSLGFIDSSGPSGEGRDDRIGLYGFPEELLQPRPDDRDGEPGSRFWIVTRDDEPIVVFEQSSAEGRICASGAAVDLMSLLQMSELLVGTAQSERSAAEMVATVVLKLVEGSGTKDARAEAPTPVRPEEPASAFTAGVAGGGGASIREAWMLTSGRTKKEIVSLEVSGPDEPGGSWEVFMEGPGFVGRMEVDGEPTTRRTPGGQLEVRGTSSGTPFTVAPVAPSDTQTVTGFHRLWLPADLLTAIVHAKMQHTQELVDLCAPDPLISLALVVQEETGFVVGLVCDFNGPDSQGWSRGEGVWVEESLMLRLPDGPDGDDDLEETEIAPDELSFVTTDPRLAGAVVAVFDAGLPLLGEDVDFLTEPFEDFVDIDDLPPAIERLIDGIAGCWLHRESWCKPDELTIVVEHFELLALLLEPADDEPDAREVSEAVRGRLLTAIGACIAALPDPGRVTRTPFDAAKAQARTGILFGDGRAFLVAQDFAEDFAEDGL